MMDQRRRQWTNIDPTLGECDVVLVSVTLPASTITHMINHIPVQEIFRWGHPIEKLSAL